MKQRVALLLTLTVVTAAAAQVSFDDGTDFGAYHSYAWKEGTPARNLDMQGLIELTVNRELEAKGLVRVDAESDLFVVTYVLPDKVSAEELARNDTLLFWSGVTSLSPTDMGAGTLVIDLVDAKSGEVAWRGVAGEAIKGSFKKMSRKVESAITKMFKRYPSP
jgi:hypothetical protein